ncbi:hypothetical protein [Microbacterium caowuchunii]|uniref:Uncharacterized protein n=1 Tax=Microbacterium caowuchunii TaxID=2614638 RepID=A0A5N0TI11_9MICO|nr:hypothetical protein [Microbacterium caowuchunii]KAA9134753.1 hypothetical protein F6B40_03325 [Microbacterium caowuchunii]
MTSTPENNDPLRNEALEGLKKQDIDSLITPDEIVFQQISEPEPTDPIGSEEWPGAPEKHHRHEK